MIKTEEITREKITYSPHCCIFVQIDFLSALINAKTLMDLYIKIVGMINCFKLRNENHKCFFFNFSYVLCLYTARSHRELLLFILKYE